MIDNTFTSKTSWSNLLPFRKSFDFYLDLDIETCADKIALIRKSISGLDLYEVVEVRVKPVAPEYEFQIRLNYRSPKSRYTEVYLTGQLNSFSGGTHITGTAIASVVMPVVGTLTFILMFAGVNLFMLNGEDRFFFTFIAGFMVFLPWGLVIVTKPHIQFINKFEAYLNSKRDDHVDHPFKTKHKKR